jgi:FkbM family methyltransferase
MKEVSNNTITNIIKGITRRLTNNQPHNRYQLSWLQEKILKHQEDRKEKSMEIAGLKIHYIRPYEVLHTWRDIFENEIYKFSADTNQPLIIDCGSNIGISVLYYKTLYPSAAIIAFEPDNKNFQLLSKNITANRISNVTLNEAAVWIENGQISFESNAAEGSSISSTGENKNPVSVSCIRLADLLKQYERIDFLKLDIEGAEDKVIADCGSLLSRIENLFVEYHGSVEEIGKLVNILVILKDCGFHCYLNNAAHHLQRPFFEKRSCIRHDVQLNIFCYR